MNRWNDGLQPQRTSLAWSRTGFAVLGNALLVLRTAANAHSGLLLALGLGLLAASGVVSLCGLSRSAVLDSSLQPACPPWLLIGSVTVVSLAVSVAGMLCMAAT